MSVLPSIPAAWCPSRLLLRTFALALLWVLLMRTIVGLHAGLWLQSPLAVLSDAAGAAMLTVLLLCLRRGWPRVVLLVLLGMAYYAAAEHLAAHGTLFRLPHILKALDPTFVRAAGAFGPGLLALPGYWALAWLLHRLQQGIAEQQPARPLGDGRLVGGGLVLILVYSLAVPSPTAPVNNVVATALAQTPQLLLGLRDAAEGDDVEGMAGDVAATFFQRRLGAPVVDQPPDLLVIMVEGLSAAYLPAIARYHGLREPAVALPGLARGLDRHGFRVYRNVLAMQRQTDRGSYSMLCGEYPRLDSSTPKMAAIAEGRRPPACLPEILRRHGYYTSYQQAADLAYMGKDRFMPRIGFDEALGAGDFRTHGEVEGWGLPDARFYARAGDRIIELDREHDGPWFATLLNVGTHHPFAVDDGMVEGDEPLFGAEPPELSMGDPHRERRAAFERMSGELLGLLDRLEGAGLLREAMVIITSDESGGFIRGEGEAGPLDGNFGFMAVRPPAGLDRAALRDRDTLVAHMDVAVTAVDAAGLGDRPAAVAGLNGHSLLAPEPERPRGLLLGDTYAGQSHFLLDSGRLMSCAETLLRCTGWRFRAERLLGTLREDDSAEFLDLATRQRLLEHAALIGQQSLPAGDAAP